MDLTTWLPALVGILGGGATYFLTWLEKRNNERRYLTKDALEAITLMHNATTLELEQVKRSEAECKLQLAEVRKEQVANRDDIFRLQQRIYELEHPR